MSCNMTLLPYHVPSSLLGLIIPVHTICITISLKVHDYFQLFCVMTIILFNHNENNNF